MSQPFCTGPCAVFVSNVAGQPVFLGTSEKGMEISETPAFEPLMNDLGGSRIPFDTQSMGEDAVITGTLTWWNEPVFNIIQAIIRGGTPGITRFGDMGTFMGSEKGGHQLFLQFPYFAKPAMALGGMPAGRRYPFAMIDKKSFAASTVAMKRFVSWHCLGAYLPGRPLFERTLYDANMSNLPAVTY